MVSRVIRYPPWQPLMWSPSTGPYMKVTDLFAACRAAVPGIGLGGTELETPSRCRLAFSGEWESLLVPDPLGDLQDRSALVAHFEKLVKKGWALVCPKSDPAYTPFKPGAGFISCTDLLFTRQSALTPLWKDKT